MGWICFLALWLYCGLMGVRIELKNSDTITDITEALIACVYVSLGPIALSMSIKDIEPN